MTTISDTRPQSLDVSSGFHLLISYGRRFVELAGAIIIFLILWQAFPHIVPYTSMTVATPTATFAEMIKLILTGELIDHTVISLGRVFIGLGFAIIVSVPLGFLLGGWFKTLEAAVSPLTNVLSFANPFTLFPVFIALFGLEELSKIMMIFWVCLWPILFSTIAGMKSVDPALIKLARTSCLDKFDMFYKVLLPASLPAVFGGIRISVLFAFFMLIGAEMIGANSGLGYMIVNACPFHWESFEVEKMWAGIATVALLGIAINGSIARIEKGLFRWREEY